MCSQIFLILHQRILTVIQRCLTGRYIYQNMSVVIIYTYISYFVLYIYLPACTIHLLLSPTS